MVEAGEGIGIVPSFALPVCRRRNVIMSRLINPAVPVDFFQIRNRGRKLSPAAEEFTTFLRAISPDGGTCSRHPINFRPANAEHEVGHPWGVEFLQPCTSYW